MNEAWRNRNSCHMAPGQVWPAVVFERARRELNVHIWHHGCLLEYSRPWLEVKARAWTAYILAAVVSRKPAG